VRPRKPTSSRERGRKMREKKEEAFRTMVWGWKGTCNLLMAGSVSTRLGDQTGETEKKRALSLYGGLRVGTFLQDDKRRHAASPAMKELEQSTERGGIN